MPRRLSPLTQVLACQTVLWHMFWHLSNANKFYTVNMSTCLPKSVMTHVLAFIKCQQVSTDSMLLTWVLVCQTFPPTPFFTHPPNISVHSLPPHLSSLPRHLNPPSQHISTLPPKSSLPPSQHIYLPSHAFFAIPPNISVHSLPNQLPPCLRSMIVKHLNNIAVKDFFITEMYITING